MKAARSNSRGLSAHIACTVCCHRGRPNSFAGTESRGGAVSESENCTPSGGEVSGAKRDNQHRAAAEKFWRAKRAIAITFDPSSLQRLVFVSLLSAEDSLIGSLHSLLDVQIPVPLRVGSLLKNPKRSLAF